MKLNNNDVPLNVIRRLPRYYRYLGRFAQEGVLRISSEEFAERMRTSASQIRQDLNCFGGFGRQGYGYNVRDLREEIARIIGIDETNTVIIIGAGNIGRALADNISFEKRGCTITGIFDRKTDLWGTVIAGHKVRSDVELPQFCEAQCPKIAALCIPEESARSVCETLIALGVTNFWNFSHFDINVHFDNVNVENVHLGDSLLTLVYKVNRPQE
ncbi:MAG: redox-sensing transcriptional repressor Rex [Oscillospiraceae bacterium]|nr:redox-sensing transcriptional repressor Rex [Oscillospiraceae bacterium]